MRAVICLLLALEGLSALPACAMPASLHSHLERRTLPSEQQQEAGLEFGNIQPQDSQLSQPMSSFATPSTSGGPPTPQDMSREERHESPPMNTPAVNRYRKFFCGLWGCLAPKSTLKSISKDSDIETQSKETIDKDKIRGLDESEVELAITNAQLRYGNEPYTYKRPESLPVSPSTSSTNIINARRTQSQYRDDSVVFRPRRDAQIQSYTRPEKKDVSEYLTFSAARARYRAQRAAMTSDAPQTRQCLEDEPGCDWGHFVDFI